MFTGIIEATGVVTKVISNGRNQTFWIESPLSAQLKPDQSVSHSGVCLTVEEVTPASHRVTAIDETLKKTNLGQWQPETIVNLERCLQLNDRLDGHIVQGHVDQTAICTAYNELDGSWEYTFEYDATKGNVTVEKGSICVNGISLTVVNSGSNYFSVAIIPYTWEHTNLQNVRVGSTVNLEFDIIGKYVARLMQR